MKNLLKILLSLQAHKKKSKDFIEVIIRLYSHGSVSLQKGGYITEKKLSEKRKAVLNYNF